MPKKISFGSKPKAKQNIKNIENWIKDGSKTDEPKEKIETMRFTIDIPVELHARMKYKCAMKKVTMKDEIHNLFEKHFK
jgi:hypothetical protein